ncbi:MAG TPA: Alw26I/Eco31I/Esp3I family type II restriction endonuclease [Ktedonobacteraceae bacterium]|jgi:Alw26I/Eco31I/Esp3I family type II restriction endonuclease
MESSPEPTLWGTSAPASNIQYGDNRRQWQEGFVEYMRAIVSHPHYQGMPAAIDENGQIRWNAPSNRPPGTKHEKLHDERYVWWQQKADALGIAQSGQWISRVAKTIHPFGKKPCQTCGRVLSLEYIYPTKGTIHKLNTGLPAEAQLNYEDLQTIFEVAEHVVTTLGDAGYTLLEKIFPEITGCGHSATALHDALQNNVVRLEPKGRLSPGAMSNAPDRLDGFHTYNLCCRHGQDTGRAVDNLRSYGVDRRAFEQWVAGDWVAADALMKSPCSGVCPRCGQEDPLTADHIGPISLGFLHRPKFQPACRGCNSAKNNRMSLDDINTLLADEEAGEKVISWQVAFLWDQVKKSVSSDAEALRLSKILRINQHYYLMLLYRIYRAGYPDMLLHFLQPEYARDRVEFVGIIPGTFEYTTIKRTPRQTSYARSKAARMVRVAFDALEAYGQKANRNIHAVPEDLLDPIGQQLVAALKGCSAISAQYRAEFRQVLAGEDTDEERDQRIMHFLAGDYRPPQECEDVHDVILQYMETVNNWLANSLLDRTPTKARREALNALAEFGEELLRTDE